MSKIKELLGKESLVAIKDYIDIKDSGKEAKENKTTILSDVSTDEQYPSAKAVVDYVDNKENLIAITYLELKLLRDNGQLIPGQQYRIIDYVTTTTQEETQSAGHQFDIIVIADDERTLNENARAVIHEGDEYFIRHKEKIISVSWKQGVTLDSITEKYKIMDDPGGDTYWERPNEEDKEFTQMLMKINRDGVEVPCLFNPDPDDTGQDDYLMYCGTYEFIPEMKNTLAFIEYTLNTDDDEILYRGPCDTHSDDVFVDISYEDIDGVLTPVMYKEDPYVYGPNSVDTEDKYVYVGDFEFEGSSYNEWEILCTGDGFYERDSYRILTPIIVVNNSFTVTREEFKEAIIKTSKTYDKWEECDADGNSKNNPSIFVLTNQLVDANIKVEQQQVANLSAWEIKYTLDNDINRFSWICPISFDSLEPIGCDAITPGSIIKFENLMSETYITLTHPTTLEFDASGGINKVENVKKICISSQGDDYFVLKNDTIIMVWQLRWFKDMSIGLENVVMVDSVECNNSYTSCTQLVYNGGKGVIYYMKDEWNNECPYDFKNIQFIRRLHSDGSLNKDYGTETYCYTFGGVRDRTIYQKGFNIYRSNIIKDSPQGINCGNVFLLPNNVFLGTSQCMTKNNVLEHGCTDNTFGDYCQDNIFGNSCTANTFSSGCYFNVFGNDCNYNTLGNECYSNTFGNECNSNTFGENCYANIFGEGCYSNTFGYSCSFNHFSEGCHSNTFDNSCHSNTFDIGCYSNSFRSNCNSNIFGYKCYNNTFMFDCSNNIFGNACRYNSFSNYCSSNSLGNGCYYNRFNNDCQSNILGYNCDYNTFNEPYVSNIELKAGVDDILLTSTTPDTANSSNYLKNIIINSGVKGKGVNNKRTITIERNLPYSTTISAPGSKEIILDEDY